MLLDISSFLFSSFVDSLSQLRVSGLERCSPLNDRCCLAATNGRGEEVLNPRTSSELFSLPGSCSGMVVLRGNVLLSGISYSAGLFVVLLDFRVDDGTHAILMSS